MFFSFFLLWENVNFRQKTRAKTGNRLIPDFYSMFFKVSSANNFAVRLFHLSIRNLVES